MSTVIFQGSKFFWRMRKTIDLTIVEHKSIDVIEIIAYEPSLDIESLRIYLDSMILSSCLDQEAINLKLSFAKRNNVPHTAAFLRSTFIAATVDFILSHLILTKFLPEENSFVVEFNLSQSDIHLDIGCDRMAKLVCQKPEGLIPHAANHFKRITQAEVRAAFTALHEEQREVEEYCDKAKDLQAQAEVALNTKERWRIPLVLVKVVKNRPLSDADAKIWSTLATNFKIQPDFEVRTSASRPATSRSPTSQCSPCPTPARSRCSTPNKTVTPRNSQRLFAGTASSQSRTQADKANDVVRVHKPPKTPKRNSKRASKLNRRRISKSHLTEVTNNMQAGLQDESASFLAQLSAGLATFTSAFSITRQAAKIRTVYVEEEDESVRSAHFSVRGSVKTLSTFADSVATTGTDATALTNTDLSDQRRHLAALHPHLLGTLSTAPSFIDSATFLADDYTPAASDLTAAPRKRRSFFGAILASFSRADSSLALGGTESTPYPHPLQQLHLSKQISKPGGQMLFGDALSDWAKTWGSANRQVSPCD